MKLICSVLLFLCCVNAACSMEEEGRYPGNSPASTSWLQKAIEVCDARASVNATALQLLGNTKIPLNERYNLAFKYSLATQEVVALKMQYSKNERLTKISFTRDTCKTVLISMLQWKFFTRSLSACQASHSGELYRHLLKEFLSALENADRDCRYNMWSHYLEAESNTARSVAAILNQVISEEIKELQGLREGLIKICDNHGKIQPAAHLFMYAGITPPSKKTLDKFSSAAGLGSDHFAGLENYAIKLSAVTQHDDTFAKSLLQLSFDSGFFNAASDTNSPLHKLLNSYILTINKPTITQELANLHRRPMTSAGKKKSSSSRKKSRNKKRGKKSRRKKRSKRARKNNQNSKTAQMKAKAEAEEVENILRTLNSNNKDHIPAQTFDVKQSKNVAKEAEEAEEAEEIEAAEDVEENEENGGDIAALNAHNNYLKYFTPLQLYLKHGGSNPKRVRELKKLAGNKPKLSSAEAVALQNLLKDKQAELEFYQTCVWGCKSGRIEYSWNRIVQELCSFGWSCGAKSGSAKKLTPPNWFAKAGLGVFPISVHAEHKPDSKPVAWHCIAFLRTGLKILQLYPENITQLLLQNECTEEK